jgi:hypothetical protein
MDADETDNGLRPVLGRIYSNWVVSVVGVLWGLYGVAAEFLDRAPDGAVKNAWIAWSFNITSPWWWLATAALMLCLTLYGAVAEIRRLDSAWRSRFDALKRKNADDIKALRSELYLARNDPALEDLGTMRAMMLDSRQFQVRIAEIDFAEVAARIGHYFNSWIGSHHVAELFHPAKIVADPGVNYVAANQTIEAWGSIGLVETSDSPHMRLGHGLGALEIESSEKQYRWTKRGRDFHVAVVRSKAKA